MSTQQTNEYRVMRLSRCSALPYGVMLPELNVWVDRFHTEPAACYAARVLNEGRAVIDSHAPLGCKVMPV